MQARMEFAPGTRLFSWEQALAEIFNSRAGNAETQQSLEWDRPQSALLYKNGPGARLLPFSSAQGQVLRALMQGLCVESALSAADELSAEEVQDLFFRLRSERVPLSFSI